MVYYRTYRPQTISDLDNAKVRETLLSVLSQKDPAHAFLFTGPKGLGKTSAARIVAKALNCQRLASSKLADSSDKKKLNAKRSTQNDGVEPCNRCEMCTSITNGTNLDVLEIDAASNRGIDEIRDLREKIRLAPLSARKKTYIIDEVHMLTNEAFNALLKTLEEPPDHAVFILATTEPHKVPETIISRCVHVTFTPATTEELKRSFSRIVKGEKIEIDEDGLTVLAGISDSGFRDGAKILEEIVSLAKGEKITPEFIESHYHTTSINNFIASFLQAVKEKKTKEAFNLISEMESLGVGIGFFIEKLLLSIHDLLLFKVGITSSSVLSDSLTKSISLDDINVMYNVFSDAYQKQKGNVVPALPLELAVLTLTSGSNEVVATEDFSERVVKTAGNGVSVVSLRRKVGEIAKEQAVNGVETPKKTRSTEGSESSVSLLSFKSDGEITNEWMEELWQAILIRMKDHNHTVAGVMRGCRIRSFDRKNLVIETAFQFHKNKLGEDKTRTVIEQVVTSLTGNPIAVSVELKSSK